MTPYENVREAVQIGTAWHLKRTMGQTWCKDRIDAGRHATAIVGESIICPACLLYQKEAKK